MVAPWTTSIMELNREEYTDCGAPSRFDVIDTSNLCDHLGMFNMLISAAPLLAVSPSSVLYTETLLTHAADPSTELELKLFASLPIVATLLDLAPVDALSGFTTRCNTHELLLSATMHGDEGNMRQHHQILTWRRPTSGDPSASSGPRTPMSFDTRQLAKLLHTIYAHVYKSEDPMSLFGTDRGNMLGTIKRGSSTCPSREAIVVLFDLIRTGLRLSSDQCSDIVAAFLALRSQDPTPTRMFDRLGDSELHAQLYRYGLYTAPGLDRVRRPATGRLSHWTSIPPLVRVFLTVPRTQFARLERMGASVPTPWLRCAIGTPQGEHIFQSVDAAFGTLTDTGNAPEPWQALSFREEADGQKKGSDLVVSFVVPSRVLVEAPASAIYIALTVRADPLVARILTPVLGLSLSVYRASLDDTDDVHLLPEQPLQSRGRPVSKPISPEGSDGINAFGRQQPVRVDLDGEGKRVISLTAKLEITNAAAQAAFAGGTSPDVSQCSPCAMQVVLGGCTQTLSYPMPIVGSRRKVRLARKSSYIDVVVPVAIPFLEPDGLKVNPFPVIRANTSLSPWNVHRVFLDSLPVLNLSKASIPQLQEWYNPHVGSQLCVRERAAIKDPARSDVLANIKETIHCIMMRFAGTQGSTAPSRTFALRDDASGDCDTLLFVDTLRFDLSAHAMVCDAFVLLLAHVLMPRVEPALQLLLRRGGIENVKLYGHEMRGWKRLLPALVERCRASWAHGADCAYAKQGRIPLELELSEGDPLCACGRGKDVEGMQKDAVWKRFAPFVTRIALSPLFAVSYLEPVFEGLGREIQKAKDFTRAARTPREADGKLGVVSSSLVRCKKCAKEESDAVKLRMCSRCKTASYCSEACQKGDWRSHKLQCGK
uniref:Mevalonyl-coenzyme A hydratase sidH ) n=1 Tax=Ganoderma boninense TaxID=34458 RepID=A0A5K1K866_9APHY|nr:Mevalonyl-coenzyme A hydratase sidH (EC (Siderophore biosynthesis protein H) [Ganoderma boninense]